jgi:hypothetical protein
VRVRDVSEGFGATVGEPVDARITIGDVTLSRTVSGWTVDADGVDLAQLDAAVQLAKHVPAASVVKAETVLSIVGEEGDGDTLSDARDLLQRHAETNGGEDAQFGGPDVEFGVGPVEENDPIYSLRAPVAAKLKELRSVNTLKVPIAMLEIGGEHVPDRTFSGIHTKEALDTWKQDVWPIWKLHEDGFITLSVDGTTAQITRRGQRCLEQIEADPTLVYDYAEDAHVVLSGSAEAWRSETGAIVPDEWQAPAYDIRLLVDVGGDPKVIAQQLWVAIKTLKLPVVDAPNFVAYVLGEYDRADDVFAALDVLEKADPAAI